MVSAGEVQIAISAKEVEIPEGYRKLNPDEIKRPDDKAWLEAFGRWIYVLSPGFPAKDLTIIRKIEEEEHSKNNPEWGAW